jgi:NitT/TauT family transport system substrate-binding protein
VARVRLAVLCFAIAAVALLGGCGASSAPKTQPRAPIRLGTYEWPGSYWIDVAWEKGWFAEAGLNVQRVDMDTKYFEALDDVVAGKLDAAGYAQYDLVRYVAAGHDLVGVAAIDYSEGAEALIARPGFHSLRDLRGKRIGLRRGSYLEYLLAIFAERAGLSMSDFELLDRSTEAALAGLKAGTQFNLDYIPRGTNERYMRLNYTVATGPMTAGKIKAGVLFGGHQTNG